LRRPPSPGLPRWRRFSHSRPRFVQSLFEEGLPRHFFYRDYSADLDLSVLWAAGRPVFVRTSGGLEEGHAAADRMRAIIRSVDSEAAAPGCYWADYADEVDAWMYGLNEILEWHQSRQMSRLHWPRWPIRSASTAAPSAWFPEPRPAPRSWTSTPATPPPRVAARNIRPLTPVTGCRSRLGVDHERSHDQVGWRVAAGHG
jgi:hypothetical protein